MTTTKLSQKGKKPIDEAQGLLKGGRSTKELLRRVRREERKLERAKNAAVVTGDPEFKNLAEIIDIDWLPKNR